MEYLADYRDAIRYRDELESVRHQRNVCAWLAIAGWLLSLIAGGLWMMQR